MIWTDWPLHMKYPFERASFRFGSHSYFIRTLEGGGKLHLVFLGHLLTVPSLA